MATKPNTPPTFPHYVRDMVVSGGNEATSADLLALSPFAVPKDAKAQTVAFLRSMFDPADNLYIFRDDVPSTGKIGTNLMPCCDWLATIEGGDATPGDLVVPNPFTGAEANEQTALISPWIVQIGTMLINFVTEFLWQRFVVYRDRVDTAKNAKSEPQA